MLNRTQQPAIQQLRQLDVQAPQRYVLPNGIDLNVINVGESEVTRIDLLIGGGRWSQTQPLQALFTNRMLREGTRSFTSAQIAEKLDYYGAWLDLSNASQHAYVTLYSLNKYLPQTLEVLESIVKEPVFPAHELDVILNTNLQQFVVNHSKVDFLAHRGLMQGVYGADHPCGRLVQEDDYHRITPEVLRSYYDCHYHSGNCSIYLSGRITDSCLRRIEAMWGSEPFGNHGHVVSKPDFVPVSTTDKRIFIERADALQSAVRMGMLTIPCSHPDYARLRVLVTLFGGYFGSRLMSNIREEKGYTYGISAGIMNYPGDGLLAISTETKNECAEPLIAEVYHEIDRLHNELVTDDELTMVKNYMLGEMCRSYESAFSLADAWLFIQASGLTPRYFDDSLQAVESITPTEIRDLAQRYLCKENLKEVICGKKMS